MSCIIAGHFYLYKNNVRYKKYLYYNRYGQLKKLLVNHFFRNYIMQHAFGGAYPLRQLLVNNAVSMAVFLLHFKHNAVASFIRNINVKKITGRAFYFPEIKFA